MSVKMGVHMCVVRHEEVCVCVKCTYMGGIVGCTYMRVGVWCVLRVNVI